MPEYVDVIVPGPWWNALTYSFDSFIQPGVRVKVPLGLGERVGFVSGRQSSSGLPERVRQIKEVLDSSNVLGEELWSLALWTGRNFMCGTGQALQMMCPQQLLKGEPLPEATASFKKSQPFKERTFFSPWDEERLVFYRSLLTCDTKTMVLFPETSAAQDFFSSLSEDVKQKSVLWPSTGGKKLWDVWKKVKAGLFCNVIASPGGVFAPLSFERIIVEGEVSSAYTFQRKPRISARTLAGQRATFLGAELILGGRMPSSKTYLRTRPKCTELPKSSELIFADMKCSFKPKYPGIEGELPLTISLLDRTREVLEAGRHVLWVLDRRGEAGSVFCSDCGYTFVCPKCSSSVRSEDGGKSLCCLNCGHRFPLPSACPSCKSSLLLGRRPGLDALASVVNNIITKYPVKVLLKNEEKKLKKDKEKHSPSLFLGTRRILSSCDYLKVGLLAWLDLDAESRKMEFGARAQLFEMIWESYWRGRRKNEDGDGRLVLMQTRFPGAMLQKMLSKGWGQFWKFELEERKGLSLPPFNYMLQIELPAGEDRDAFIYDMENAELFVMDPGDIKAPLWITANSTETLGKALAPRFEICCSKRGFPDLTFFTE